jgi:hypothetical protein
MKLEGQAPTAWAKRSAKPRSSTGADVPSMSRQLLPHPAGDRMYAAPDTGRATRPWVRGNQDQEHRDETARQEEDGHV